MKNRGCFLLMILSFCVIVSGCAGGYLAGESYVGPVLPEETAAVNAMAADVVRKLVSMYPPGHTAIELVRPQIKDGQGNAMPQKAMDAFTLALEDGLRKSGFSISPDAPLRLAWTLDRLAQEGEASQQMARQMARQTARQTAGQTAGQGKGGSEMDWWLRLKLADADKFEVWTLTRMYDGSGAPLAGFAASM